MVSNHACRAESLQVLSQSNTSAVNFTVHFHSLWLKVLTGENETWFQGGM